MIPRKGRGLSLDRQRIDAQRATLPGCVALRRVRTTRAVVGLFHAGPDATSGEWEVRCLTHEWTMPHPTRHDAESWIAHPEHWCSGCTASYFHPTLPPAPESP